MPAPPIIHDLIERFRANLDSYKHGPYNETLTRIEFINPFFKALGWDMDNERGYAEAYKDVVHEDAVKVGGGTTVARNDRMVGLAERMLDLHQKLAAEGALHVSTVLQRHAEGGGHRPAD